MNLGSLGWNGYTGMAPETANTISKLPPGFHPFLEQVDHDQPVGRPPAEFWAYTEGVARVHCEECLTYEKQAAAYRREILALERSLQSHAKRAEDTTRQRPWSLEKESGVPTSVVWGAA